jgi:putative resolvase
MKETTKSFIKIGKFARDLGISRQTLYNWKKQGRFEFVKVGKHNAVSLHTYYEFMGIKEKKEEKVVIYSRVSSTANKSNLEAQANRLKDFCIAKGYNIHKIVKEFGSGLNDHRAQLLKLLEEQDFTKLVVEHRDRLTRSGFNYIKTMLETNGIVVEVVNEAEDNEEDIIQDFVAIVTSYCARIYGRRRSKRKTEKLIKALKENNDD